jgi:phosphatidylserine decarboxylase
MTSDPSRPESSDGSPDVTPPVPYDPEHPKTFTTDLLRTIRETIAVPVHPAGWPFIAGAAFVAVVLGMMSGCLGLIGLLLAGSVYYFFRDPVRAVPQRAGLVVSPADGLVTAITENAPWPPEVAGGQMRTSTRISIFLSVLDVHVNRVPLAGVVKQVTHRPGLFLNAGSPASAQDNERSTTVLETAEGRVYAVVQIAGLIARRIVNDLKEGQRVEAGTKMGIIRFGSRVDVYLPEGVEALVVEGQRAVGGETILADLDSAEESRKGKRL